LLAKAECDRTIAELEKQLLDDPDFEYKDQVLDEIAHERTIWEIIERVVPDCTSSSRLTVRHGEFPLGS
jgi:hypothetical protein